ncbi:MAG TPA: hypothetical protein VMV86_04230 [Methanosarcinales archaeon]|nr:hypothetical protein [Methanosarcinales archaeon]
MGWREWSQTQWDKWGSKLQPTYDKIDEWETPEWVQAICGQVWEFIDEPMKKKLYEFVMEVCKNYDAEFAKKLLEDLLHNLLTLLRVKNDEDNG